jgi:hypothetical protein
MHSPSLEANAASQPGFDKITLHLSSISRQIGSSEITSTQLNESSSCSVHCVESTKSLHSAEL